MTSGNNHHTNERRRFLVALTMEDDPTRLSSQFPLVIEATWSDFMLTSPLHSYKSNFSWHDQWSSCGSSCPFCSILYVAKSGVLLKSPARRKLPPSATSYTSCKAQAVCRHIKIPFIYFGEYHIYSQGIKHFCYLCNYPKLVQCPALT